MISISTSAKAQLLRYVDSKIRLFRSCEFNSISEGLVKLHGSMVCDDSFRGASNISNMRGSYVRVYHKFIEDAIFNLLTELKDILRMLSVVNIKSVNNQSSCLPLADTQLQMVKSFLRIRNNGESWKKLDAATGSSDLFVLESSLRMFISTFSPDDSYVKIPKLFSKVGYVLDRMILTRQRIKVNDLSYVNSIISVCQILSYLMQDSYSCTWDDNFRKNCINGRFDSLFGCNLTNETVLFFPINSLELAAGFQESSTYVVSREAKSYIAIVSYVQEMINNNLRISYKESSNGSDTPKIRPVGPGPRYAQPQYSGPRAGY